jgi:collagenase-like PrtC family protease
MPADFHYDTLKGYAELNKKNYPLKVSETYGNLNPGDSPLGTGRIKTGLPAAGYEKLKDRIKWGRDFNISFNYTINSRCTHNMEFTSKGYLEILKHIEKLMNAGVEQLTLASPSLLQIIHSHFPDLHIIISVITQIKSIKQVQVYKDMGASRIILSEDVNRNFNLLSTIGKNTDLPLEIIVNTRCLFYCSMRNSDYNFLSHCGAKNYSLPVFDYYKWICTQYLFKNPIEFFKMPWIRPEDISYYNDISYFKVIGRQLVAHGDLLRTAETYMKGEFDGNLIDLMGLFSPQRKEFYPINIDNKGLKDFILYFVEGKCHQNGCHNCNHCTSYLKKNLSPAEMEKLKKYSALYDREIKNYIQSKKNSSAENELFLATQEL